MHELHVHYLPQFVAEADLADRVVIVVDLLRASTTLCHALAAGATSAVAFVEVDQALRAADECQRSEVLLGGERGGQRIKGFDLGNSPAEYTADRVFGKRLLFTTTNGAKAIEHARLARRMLIGAAVNRRVVVEAVASESHVDILCAGTRGNVSRDDVLAAGAIASQLLGGDEAIDTSARQTNRWAEAAAREWQELCVAAQAAGITQSVQFAAELRRTPHGRDLTQLGFDADLDLCSELDVLNVLPERDPTTGEIRPA